MTFTTIGSIGAGTVAQAVARHAIRAGHPVTLSNSRGPETLAALVAELGGEAKAGAIEDAIDSDVVLLAIPFIKVPELTATREDWSGVTVIDMTNQFSVPGSDAHIEDVSPLTGSEWIERQLPGATVIKAFNAMFSTYISPDPAHAEGRQAVFFAGDSMSTKAQFEVFLDSLGFAGIDLGGLREGGALMQLGGPLSGRHFLFQG